MKQIFLQHLLTFIKKPREIIAAFGSSRANFFRRCDTRRSEAEPSVERSELAEVLKPAGARTDRECELASDFKKAERSGAQPSLTSDAKRR